MLAVMNWHILVMEQHAMVQQQAWPLPHLHPLNPLVLQRKQKRKWAPQREPQARDMVPTMERKRIQTAMLTMERRAAKAMAPNLITEIHVNGTGGQGANGLCHCPPCASQGSLHHQTMSRLACFLLLLLFLVSYCSSVLATEIVSTLPIPTSELQNLEHKRGSDPQI
jgi:hypothetical protein